MLSRQLLATYSINNNLGEQIITWKFPLSLKFLGVKSYGAEG